MRKTPQEVMGAYTIAELKETSVGYFSYGCRSSLINADDSVKESALRHIRYWTEWFKRLGPSFDRTKAIHKLMDAKIAEVRANEKVVQVSCKAGCANCCRTLVHVSEDEAKLLARRVLNGVKIDEDKLARQANPAHDAATWFKLSKGEGTCVFLGADNNCRVYDNRPSSCRNYLVTTSPDLCCPDESGNPRDVEYYNVFEAELLSTIESRLSAQGTLPIMLMQQLKEMR